PTHDVIPELARGKSFADHYRSAANQQRPGRGHAAGGVVERKTIIHAVSGARVYHSGKGMTHEHQAIVVDVGSLGEAGRAGGVDVKRAVLDGQARALRLREAVA